MEDTVIYFDYLVDIRREGGRWTAKWQRGENTPHRSPGHTSRSLAMRYSKRQIDRARKEWASMRRFEFTLDEIGYTVSRLREAQDMSRQQLADKVGISRQSIESIEKGKSTPKPDNLIVIMYVLGFDVTPAVRLRAEIGEHKAYEVYYVAEAREQK